ncbi:SH3 domain-binding glutamic acid-rich-like protein 3 [Enhydra lutris kenyoni]|uniref:SH3 domain-binding glutamic acid-rich-like protein 3 n=1 Tax=Enhydra lutris kenyoni TaxID=391180 RepID=A0A2Y9L116_ENHLU|nr:SH3 domain-binding glutamic acid-rich-like protein 3 [Enhydra lutris kenyoni]
MSSIKVYYTSVSGSREVKQRQEEVTGILDIYQIKYELIDISVSLKVLQEMRMKVSTCGIRDLEMFHKAKENKEILKFLKME